MNQPSSNIDGWRRSYSMEFPNGKPDVERYWHETCQGAKPVGIGKQSFQVWVFVGACAMFAYGHIEQAFDIIRHMPTGPSRASPNVRGGNMQILKDLLPMPEDFDPLNTAHHEAILAWLRENVPRLRWDEEQGLYVWKE